MNRAFNKPIRTSRKMVITQDYQILIDNRESIIKNYFKDYPNVEFRNLDIGDIVFKYNGEILLLIERKTMGDLLSSIKDGRYKEQKIRIMNSGIEKGRILYLIEAGKVNHHNPQSKLVWGCMVSMMIRDQIKILRTVDATESIQFLDRIYNRISKKPESLIPISNNYNINDSKNGKNIQINSHNNLQSNYVKNITQNATQNATQNEIQNPSDKLNCGIKKIDIDYTSSIKMKKKDNLTPIRCNLLQLAQIPGVSPKIAYTILKKYGTIYNLCCQYEKTPLDQRELLLANFKFEIANNKSRRIGNVVSSRIYHFLRNC